MITSMVAGHAIGHTLNDVIFGANSAALDAISKVGAKNVTNATIGAILDENEQLACIPTVAKIYKNMPMKDIIAYAPIAGLPKYLKATIDLTLGENKVAGFVEAVATAGGTGAIHHAIANYSECGDSVLTSDWFWSPYNVLANEAGRKLDTFMLFDEEQNFNFQSFTAKVTEILHKQNSLLIILNTPAHNPTGYSLSDKDWEQVIDICKSLGKDKKISILIDIAYIDYAGEKNAVRSFLKNFDNLPTNIFIMFAFSMSKGYTLYGQRTGAIIGLSAQKNIIEEFLSVNKYTSRATWSNINRGAMTLLATIQEDKTLCTKFEEERTALYELIKERATIFMQEAKESGLKALPYKAGFFLSIPSNEPATICERLQKDYVFAVPLKKGVRLAVCAITKEKMKGLAGKIKKAIG